MRNDFLGKFLRGLVFFAKVTAWIALIGFLLISLIVLVKSCEVKAATLVVPEGNGTKSVVISGLPAGFSTLSVAKQQELERVVLYDDPKKNSVRLTGLTDTLGWPALPLSEWAKADSGVGFRRVNRAASFYRSLGWQVEIAGVETQTQYRGVRVEIVPRADATAPTNGATDGIEMDSKTNTDTKVDNTVHHIHHFPDTLRIELIGSRPDSAATDSAASAKADSVQESEKKQAGGLKVFSAFGAIDGEFSWVAGTAPIPIGRGFALGAFGGRLPAYRLQQGSGSFSASALADGTPGFGYRHSHTPSSLLTEPSWLGMGYLMVENPQRPIVNLVKKVLGKGGAK